ncbi:hypothetical protein [Fimbriimonas ginsengisoli]|uniref:Uncharacterized protein n=1 Tax=Fimbriimonas ginsengisoli Gsoil 348 TaxID=661478 RepID=A0A068NSB5_FIMGI|nr:hypothetical protein [Fimbriimonas ginsengisoli]AIE86438.1 hypothetical protein OP10G_3070 [Fimbriimonas ginsengisoli Gsoil 348]
MSLVLASLAFLLAQGDGKVRMKQVTLARPGSLVPSLMIQARLDPMEPGRLSPKKFGVGNARQAWEFPWVMTGFVSGVAAPWELRFRVYSQDHKEDRDALITRMLLTLQQENLHRLKLDHAVQYNGKIVDVFLCWGGTAGGEQRFDIAEEGGFQKSVNTIYIYDVNSFTEPMEMAREIAHEYGHASLPAIGGYKEPEDWANGYLGEKLFLSWIRQGMEEGRLVPEDVMGVTKELLDKWLAANVTPLVQTAASNFPIQAALANPSKAGMDRYLGLALFASQVLPDAVFGRSLLLTGSTEAKDYPQALTLATEEPDSYTVRIPKSLANKPIWLPLGKGKVTGAKILQFRGKWIQLEAPEGTLNVVNRTS